MKTTVTGYLYRKLEDEETRPVAQNEGLSVNAITLISMRSPRIEGQESRVGRCLNNHQKVQHDGPII